MIVGVYCVLHYNKPVRCTGVQDTTADILLRQDETTNNNTNCFMGI